MHRNTNAKNNQFRFSRKKIDLPIYIDIQKNQTSTTIFLSTTVRKRDYNNCFVKMKKMQQIN